MKQHKNRVDIKTIAKIFADGDMDEKEFKKHTIEWLCAFDTVIPDMLQIIDNQRKVKNLLFDETNHKLGMAYMGLTFFDGKGVDKNAPLSIIKKEEIAKSIETHYEKWEDYTGNPYYNNK